MYTDVFLRNKITWAPKSSLI